jgi:DNA polymerase III epsilon subunit-like protein
VTAPPAPPAPKVPLCFVDTETTGLHPDLRCPWDIAIIRHDPDGTREVWQTFIALPDLNLGHADPFALQVGRFHDRHPQATATVLPIRRAEAEPWPENLMFADDAAVVVERLTRDAVMIGTVVSFDMGTLAAMLYREGLCPSWHYRPVCVETRAAGRLEALGEVVEEPWHSEDLSRRCGVEPPAGQDRHTALGDALWGERWHKTLKGGAR